MRARHAEAAREEEGTNDGHVEHVPRERGLAGDGEAIGRACESAAARLGYEAGELSSIEGVGLSAELLREIPDEMEREKASCPTRGLRAALEMCSPTRPTPA